MPEINNQSKDSRGGKRKGAGRKPCTISGVEKKMARDTAHLILAKIKANQKWVDLAESDDPRIRFEVLRYLTDRAYGRPKQSVEHSGKDGEPIQTSVVVSFV